MFFFVFLSGLSLVDQRAGALGWISGRAVVGERCDVLDVCIGES